MKIEILGPGCIRCNQLYDNTVKAVADMGAADIDVVKISDIKYFAKMGVFMTPGLVIDGEVIATGKVLTPSEIKAQVEKKR